MSYNGVGLTTPRGSGTNGYVQKNQAYIREKQRQAQFTYNQAIDRHAPIHKEPNKEILEHERKRQVEVKVMEWAEKEGILDSDIGEAEIQKKMAEKRKELLERFSLNPEGFDRNRIHKMQESHQLAMRKNQESEKIRDALHIGSDYKTGSAFDPKVQEQKKKEREDARLERETQKLIKDLEREKKDKEDRRRSRSERDDRKAITDKEDGRDRRDRDDHRGRDRRGRSRSPRSRHDSPSPTKRHDSASPEKSKRHDSASPNRSNRHDSASPERPTRHDSASPSRDEGEEIEYVRPQIASVIVRDTDNKRSPPQRRSRTPESKRPRNRSASKSPSRSPPRNHKRSSNRSPSPDDTKKKRHDSPSSSPPRRDRSKSSSRSRSPRRSRNDSD
eukprot:TRINITY_DN3115_c0_g1_i1.p1 TRINITY_DN3115_c0_g1~~TRINITY_DN3115_c0_g1_i1.p1  ORF type:complete len:388 (+),score=86.41 TRINITY_DN3115_c0_g1_i1:133-1296(+)